jgi:hypothetical protein
MAADPRDGDVVLLVGTMKGAFILHADRERKQWRMDGPHFRGMAVYALAMDQRGGRRRILASTQSMHWGAVICSSDDFGATWSDPERQNVRFAEGSEDALANIWQIRPGRASEPDVVYCGVEPAALFESRDAGESWSPVRGLLYHPHRKQWEPGGGGLCLHTIVLDPADDQRMAVAISTGGVYRTDDGGATWRARNVGVRAEFLPDKHPEFGQCVHKVVNHPSRPERLFLQNHGGLYRSDDWGDSWTDIANGVPSDFGFAMAMHPHDPDTVYIVPLAARLPHPRRRRVVAAARKRPAPARRLRDRAPRRPRDGHARPRGPLLRHARRQALRLRRRGRELDGDRGRPAPHRLRQGGGDRRVVIPTHGPQRTSS